MRAELSGWLTSIFQLHRIHPFPLCFGFMAEAGDLETVALHRIYPISQSALASPS